MNSKLETNNSKLLLNPYQPLSTKEKALLSYSQEGFDSYSANELKIIACVEKHFVHPGGSMGKRDNNSGNAWYFS